MIAWLVKVDSCDDGVVAAPNAVEAALFYIAKLNEALNEDDEQRLGLEHVEGIHEIAEFCGICEGWKS